MKKNKLLILILTLIIILFIILIKIIDNKINFSYLETNFFYTKYVIVESKTFFYKKNGYLDYTISTNYIEYFPKKKIIYIYNPLIKIFDKNIKIKWIISSKKARIKKNKFIKLLGNVKIKNLTKKYNIKLIKTNILLINMINKNVISNKKTILYTKNIIIYCNNIYGNLIKKKIVIFNKIKTFLNFKFKKI